MTSLPVAKDHSVSIMSENLLDAKKKFSKNADTLCERSMCLHKVGVFPEIMKRNTFLKNLF